MLVNLTPHPISFYNDKNELIYTVEPSRKVARLKTEIRTTGYYEVDNAEIPITRTEFGKIENLPEHDDGETEYIISSFVAQACTNRWDIFIPNDPVQDENGNIIGYHSLGRINVLY